MKKIGILRGMETTFPDGLIAHINDAYADRGVHAEFVQLGGIRDTGEAEYAVILDRISHEVPFYRSFLKWASLKGTYVVNNPFWWSADDKFIDNVIAERVGVAVPRTVILPHKERPTNTEESSYRNLQYPLNWDAVFDYVGFPAFLKPHDGGGWRGVTKVRNREEFFAAFDASGDDCMMLQEGIEFEEYYRCYGIGQRDVLVMRYNPAVPMHERYSAVPDGPIEPERLAKLERDVLALCRALGYDMNTVEFAVRDGVPYAIDFMNPAPDADYWSVGQANYEWVIRQMGAFLVEKALEERSAGQFTANGALEPFGGRGLIGAVAGTVAGAAGAAVDVVKRVVRSRKTTPPAEVAPVPTPSPETAPGDAGDMSSSVPEAEALEVTPATKPTGRRQPPPSAAKTPTSTAGKPAGKTKTSPSAGKDAMKAKPGKAADESVAVRAAASGTPSKRKAQTPPDQQRPAPKAAPARPNAVAASKGDKATKQAPASPKSAPVKTTRGGGPKGDAKRVGNGGKKS
jgi:hypothetical protein